mmetsp:Transcript_84937/g.203574  ORF Transcript_84937/g.203574 Transcript_84937/m.203574 type:complete len:273 (+) Transcript_84937:397-1215(+)
MNLHAAAAAAAQDVEDTPRQQHHRAQDAQSHHEDHGELLGTCGAQAGLAHAPALVRPADDHRLHIRRHHIVARRPADLAHPRITGAGEVGGAFNGRQERRSAEEGLRGDCGGAGGGHRCDSHGGGRHCAAGHAACQGRCAVALQGLRGAPEACGTGDHAALACLDPITVVVVHPSHGQVVETGQGLAAGETPPEPYAIGLREPGDQRSCADAFAEQALVLGARGIVPRRAHGEAVTPENHPGAGVVQPGDAQGVVARHRLAGGGAARGGAVL